jgi:acyl-[acyl-carrier-protein]-phospholipid O-acyltransferase/long-chain-fatty-acid--[acyl-carrier-protein] ligase
MLHLKGVNIFPGYLDAPEKTDEVFVDGWFVTGDLARIDEDGFLFIEGRLSRFSKIGGEMVPHGVVEEQIARFFGFAEHDRPIVAAVGVVDEGKGETLALLSAEDLTMEVLRGKSRELGLPNLWMPKRIIRVEEIPCLASGKLDLRKIQELAKAE